MENSNAKHAKFTRPKIFHYGTRVNPDDGLPLSVWTKQRNETYNIKEEVYMRSLMDVET